MRDFKMICGQRAGAPRVTLIKGGWFSSRILFRGPITVQVLRMRALALFLMKSADLLESVA